ncbi:hypothetical protein CYMTET_21252 [Cymbomonas tetramitiformis]|uniref:Uncharacterized protein n=1 Tax=Cymbomonas tetramitiformis TaxID=36881 RepID=A0AAE0L3D3_9CHLO|nr:hypothetical protein CYMTET_21252 [Cymbomonas tetramitiformis]
MFVKKIDAAYPGKFDVVWNVADILNATVPDGAGWENPDTQEKSLWRKGAFEIMRLDNGDLLYSKVNEGAHLVDGKGGPEGKLGLFVDEVLGALEEVDVKMY